MIKLDSYLEKPFVKFILWFLIGLFIVFYGILNVKADEVYNRGAEFNWCDNYTDKCYITNVRYNDNAFVTLIGPYNAVDYNQGKFEYLAGIRFWSEIDGKQNDVVSLFYTLTFTGLQEQETYSNDWLNTKSSYYSSTNVSILNVKLISNTYKEDEQPTIIDGNPVWLGTQTIKFKVNVQLNEDINASSLYVGFGSYSTANDLSSKLVYQHIANVVTSIADNYYSVDNSSTIINQNDTIINQNQQTNEELSDINDNLTNSDVTGVEDSFEQFEGFLEDNSTITQLITLPITLYSSILNNVGGSCQPFNLGSLYGENLVLPCVNIGNYLGSTLWGMIDLIISGFAVYFIAKKLIKVFNNFSSMKDGDVIDD